MGAPHFHFALGLLDFLGSTELPEAAKPPHHAAQKELALLVERADKMEDWEMDAFVHSCRATDNFTKGKPTSRIPFAFPESLVVEMAPPALHPRTLVAGGLAETQAVDLQYLLSAMLHTHGAKIMVGQAPRGDKARKLMGK